MALKKNSIISDAIGNLYKAAFFLAKKGGDKRLAIELIKNASKKFPSVKKVLDKYQNANHLLLAEKILDQYLLLK